MYDYNETFTKSASQFADVAANVNRLALENAEKVFGLHFAAVETNINAAFAFANELVGVRDADGLKAALPKGIQIARTNAERSFGAAQEAFADLAEKVKIAARSRVRPLETREARAVEAAVTESIDAGVLTADIASRDVTPASTSQVGDAVLQRLRD